ncbi:Terpenoid synthase [Penicillium sp. IBT 16267x]|nr:Terpenoid synthase [Penicillium sp. IBT 16267x]
MASNMNFEPPSSIPQRTSSANATNGSTSPSGKSKHRRNKSSVDGTKYRDGTWSPKNEEILMGPYDYLQAHPGKDVRRAMIEAFNSWLQVPPDSLAIITRVVAMLHTASLLLVPPRDPETQSALATHLKDMTDMYYSRIDDVEDNSVLRRGIPVAHNIFGTAQTINSANYVYFLALQEVQKLNNPTAINIFVNELLNLHRGQGMDLFWRDTLNCPTEDEYLEMVGNKTGGLFRLAVKLMQAESATGKDCVSLVNVLGLIFQICDDYLNLCNTTYTQNKGMCEDLTEGKFSFPIIHSIRSNPKSHQLISILKQKTTDEEVKRYAVQYMESTGSFEHCRNVVKGYREQALLLIDEIDATPNTNGAGDGSMVRAVLNKIVNSTLESK